MHPAFTRMLVAVLACRPACPPKPGERRRPWRRTERSDRAVAPRFLPVASNAATRRLLSLLAFTLTLPSLAQSPTRLSNDAPILNWRLPSFTPEGYRESLVRGSEARVLNGKEFALTGLTLTLFSGDATNRVETILLSPAARVQAADRVVTSDSTLRIINDRFEATGTGWRYEHGTKRVSIAKNVRVVLQLELKDLLK